MKAIYFKELQGYFLTSVGYVFIGVFLFLSSLFFTLGNLTERSSNMLYLLRNMSYLWMLLCPILTMRLFAGERQQKTEALLYSSPCSLSGMTLGKYFAACTVLLLAVAFSFVYPLIIALAGRLYLAETMVGYLGFTLMGCCFIALDLLISSFSKSQPSAAVACLGVNMTVWLFDVIALVLHGLPSTILTFFSLYQRFTPFTLGQLSFANILFGVLFIIACLFLCIRHLDDRRWSGQ